MLIMFDTGSNGFILSRGKDNLSGTELSTSLGKLIAQYRDVLMVAHKIPWCIINVGMTFSSIFGNVSFECGHTGADSFCKISLVDITYLDTLFSDKDVDYESISLIVGGILEDSYFSYMTSVLDSCFFDFSDIELCGRFSTRGSMLKPILHQESIQFISNKISYARVRERLELFGFDFVIRNIDDTLRGTFTAVDVCKILETIQYIRDRFLSGGFSFDVVIRGVGSVYPIDYFECCRGELVSLVYDRRNSGNITTVLSDGTVGVYSTSIADDYITFKFLIQSSNSMYKLMGSSFFDVNKFFSVVERSVFEFGEFVGCQR